MSLRDMTGRHGPFIEKHVRELDDAAAFGFGQAATLVRVNASYFTTGAVTEAPAEVAVLVDGPHEALDQYQGAEFAPVQSKTVLFYLPAEGLDAPPLKSDRLLIVNELGDTVTYVATVVEPLQVRGRVHVYRLRCGQVVVDG